MIMIKLDFRRIEFDADERIKKMLMMMMKMKVGRISHMWSHLSSGSILANRFLTSFRGLHAHERHIGHSSPLCPDAYAIIESNARDSKFDRDSDDQCLCRALNKFDWNKLKNARHELHSGDHFYIGRICFKNAIKITISAENSNSKFEQLWSSDCFVGAESLPDSFVGRSFSFYLLNRNRANFGLEIA